MKGNNNGPLVTQIGDQIRSSLRPSNENFQSQFLPLSDLEYILSQPTIDKILKETLKCTDLKSKELSFKIRGENSSLKIFATLMLIEQANLIIEFLDHCVYDEQLPLDDKATVFEKWERLHIEVFCERQYMVTAPVFDFTVMQHYKWGEMLRMPFLESLEWKARGAHGEIARVRIHPDHRRWGNHSSPSLEEPCFAVKRFTTQDATEFEQERAALLQFSDPNNEHKSLIKLLLSYQIKDEFYMIFPWAQGNLCEYWENHSSDLGSKEDWIWLIQQCVGMSDGLSKVHGDDPASRQHWNSTQVNNRDRGRHGDIKPENILFFKDPGSTRGHLVVADFTLMRFHSSETVRNTLASQIDFSRAYCPPEVNQSPESIVDQSYDVWTFGCVYLEFITWYILGYDAVRKDSFKTPSGNELNSFLAMRQKDSKHPDDGFFSHSLIYNPKVKKSVKKWIKMLHKSEHCSDAMHDFLTLIEKHMLVPLPENRYSMNKVRDELQIIELNCQEDNEYCYAGNPKGSFRRWMSHLLS